MILHLTSARIVQVGCIVTTVHDLDVGDLLTVYIHCEAVFCDRLFLRLSAELTCIGLNSVSLEAGRSRHFPVIPLVSFGVHRDNCGGDGDLIFTVLIAETLATKTACPVLGIACSNTCSGFCFDLCKIVVFPDHYLCQRHDLCECAVFSSVSRDVVSSWLVEGKGNVSLIGYGVLDLFKRSGLNIHFIDLSGIHIESSGEVHQFCFVLAEVSLHRKEPIEHQVKILTGT